MQVAATHRDRYKVAPSHIHTRQTSPFARPHAYNTLIQQQHVDCKIADALLKKGTKQHADGWDASSKDWTHMVLHLPHAEGGFSVPFNCVTKDDSFYATTSRFVSFLGVFSQERQRLWFPADDLQDSSSWTSSPLVLLRDIHADLLEVRLQGGLCAVSITG